jgi:hypothetical protein
MQMRKIPSAITENRCACGARRNESSRRCLKCAARGRWYRRKAWSGRKSPDRYRTGKK